MSRARKFSALLAVIIVAGLLLTACGPKAAPAPQGSQSASAAKKPAVGGDLNLRLKTEPDSFNPILYFTMSGGAIVGQVYATLFEFNEKWEPTPYVAESWSASPDGLVWTIKLKQGVKFHDGNELTADDVVFTLMSCQDKGYLGPRASTVAPIKTATAKDKYTVVLELKESYAPLLSQINMGILEKKLFDGYAPKDFDKAPASLKPVGAGPYKFVDYKRGQYVLLERNDDWFMSKDRGGAPFIKTVRFKVIPDDTTAVAELENGGIDEDTPLPTEIGRMEKEDKDKLVSLGWERNGWGYITMNLASPKLSDPRVRQALTFALDRKSIIDGALDGRGVIPAGPIPSVSWAFDPSIKAYPFDPGKAKQLLDEAGWKVGDDGIREKDGQKLKLTFFAASGSPSTNAVVDITRKNWKDVGVDTDVHMMEYNAMLDNYLTPGKFDVSLAGLSLGLDPDQYFMWHTSQIPQTPASKTFNKGRYSNSDVDKLLEQGRKEPDPAKRLAIYSEFQKRFVEDAPVILVYSNIYTDMYARKIKGVVNYPGGGAAYIYRWWINEQ